MSAASVAVTSAMRATVPPAVTMETSVIPVAPIMVMVMIEIKPPEWRDAEVSVWISIPIVVIRITVAVIRISVAIIRIRIRIPVLILGGSIGGKRIARCGAGQQNGNKHNYP
jgi:hypothetical protein